MAENWDAIKADVENNGNVLTVTMERLRLVSLHIPAVSEHLPWGAPSRVRRSRLDP